MSIKEVLMKRDSMTSEEAEELIQEAKEALKEYLQVGDLEGAHDICEEFFGLEPDYLDELIPIEPESLL